MKLSIIIVNYKVKHFLEQCLISLQRATENVDSEIFVVDNHSQDDSIAYLSSRFPDVHYIANEQNVGFARANNQAIRVARGEYILLLNPDTVVGENTLTEVCDFMDKTPDAGGVGVKMIDGNGRFLPESKRGFPTLWASFCKIFGLNKLFPYSRLFGRYHLKYLSKNKTHNIDVLSGAFCMLRRKTLDVCGLLDEDYFMYGEDIDLSYRITQTGMKNYYLPVSIIHYKGESTKKETVAYVKVFYNAMLIFFGKHYKHYKGIYVLAVKSAISFRAFLAIGRRFARPVLSLIFDKKPEPECYYIISKMHSDITKTLPSNKLYTITDSLLSFDMKAIKGKKKNIHLIIDNRYTTYREMFSFMEKYSKYRIEFYIYSAESGHIISSNEIYTTKICSPTPQSAFAL